MTMRRCLRWVAVIGCSLASTTFAQTTKPTTREGPPPLTSLDALRIDRRMTVFQTGDTVEPFPRDGVEDAATSFVVELSSHRDLLVDLAKRHATTQPSVRLLPEDSRTADRFGIVTADHAILRTSPTTAPGDRENMSDVTLGEPVWIVDRDDAGDALLVHASDGYLGWIDAKAAWSVDRPLFVAWTNRWSRGWIEAYDAQYKPHTDGLATMLARRDAAAALRATIPHPETRLVAHSGPTTFEVVRERAEQFSGTRYVWGGKTADGIDCSGLTQTSFARVGVALPRDADQQSLVGRLVATRWCLDALLPGDLLFYVSPRRGNVHHVAIYLGNGEYIEAAGPDVHVSSMTPGAPNYDAKRAATFGWARRVIE